MDNSIKDHLIGSSKVIVFAGAGISRSSPANIPLFFEMNESILQALDPNLDFIRHYSSSIEEAQKIRERIVKLRPENLLGELKTILGPEGLRFLLFFRRRRRTR